MILNILKYPDKRLRTIAKPVVNVDETIKQQVKDMFETSMRLLESDLLPLRLIFINALLSLIFQISATNQFV